MEQTLETWRVTHYISDEAYVQLCDILKWWNPAAYVDETILSQYQTEIDAQDDNTLFPKSSAFPATLERACDTLLAPPSSSYQNMSFPDNPDIALPSDGTLCLADDFQYYTSLSMPSRGTENANTSANDALVDQELTSLTPLGSSQPVARSPKSRDRIFESWDPLKYKQKAARKATPCILCWKRKSKVLRTCFHGDQLLIIISVRRLLTVFAYNVKEPPYHPKFAFVLDLRICGFSPNVCLSLLYVIGTKADESRGRCNVSIEDGLERNELDRSSAHYLHRP